MDVRYYIKHPNGRERIAAWSDTEAVVEFEEHWSATANWVADKKELSRELVKETRETLVSETLKGKVR